MIQRIQTIYLFLAAACMITFLMVPSFSVMDEATLVPFKAGEDTGLLIPGVLVIILALVNIFLYKNRPLQIRLGKASLILAAVVAFILGYRFYTYVEGISKIALDFGVALPPIVLILLLLAIKGIQKDEKLVRAADRFR